jgi:acyl-CoA thioester hydrolase
MQDLELKFSIPVEFDDLDAGMVVYHANYLKVCDRVRNRWLNSLGLDFVTLKAMDTALAVRSLQAEFMRPISLGTIDVKLRIMSIGRKSMTVEHEIRPQGVDTRVPYFKATVVLVAANYSTGRACELPGALARLEAELREPTV